MRNGTNSNEIVAFEGVSKTFPPRGEVALRDVSFSVARMEFVCIVGPSGCGKSTVLKIIAGLEKESTGVVRKPENVSMVFQSGALLPWLNVYENVAFGLYAEDVSEEKMRAESLKYIEMMGLGEFMGKYPRELSGGQRQRVGIARALVVGPDVLLLDEPFSALDPKITYELHNDLVKMWQETKKTVIMVSHLIEEAISLAERIILMKNFTIEKTFPIDLPRPRHEQAEAFAKEVLEIRKEFFK